MFRDYATYELIIPTEHELNIKIDDWHRYTNRVDTFVVYVDYKFGNIPTKYFHIFLGRLGSC